MTTTACGKLDAFKTLRMRVAWVFIEDALNTRANNFTDEEDDVVGDLMALIKGYMGGSLAVASALSEYEINPDILLMEDE